MSPAPADFLAVHDEAESKHLPLVRAALKDGTCRLESVSRANVPCSGLLDTYRGRAIHLEQFSGEHAAGIRTDVLALVRALEAGPDLECRIFIFNFDDGRTCKFFVGTSGRMLGAILARSKILTPPETWESLWPRK